MTVTINDDDLLARITTLASNIIGSWIMIGAQTLVIASWFALNLVHNSPTGRFDNERFDTLRLLLGFQSVYTAPLILMAQRRAGAKDRAVLHDIDANERGAMKLRLEAMERRIRLEEKVDRLLALLDVDHTINVDKDRPATPDGNAGDVLPR